jgi:hypothetical protein
MTFNFRQNKKWNYREIDMHMLCVLTRKHNPVIITDPNDRSY